MQFDLAREFRIRALEKLQKLLVAVTRITLTDDFALRHFQRGKQSRRPAALVVTCT